MNTYKFYQTIILFGKHEAYAGRIITINSSPLWAGEFSLQGVAPRNPALYFFLTTNYLLSRLLIAIMSGCPAFTIRVRMDLNLILGRVKQEAARNGVMLSGDTRSGCFSGKVSGSYNISRNVVTVKITDKPANFDCTVIEQRIRNYFEG